MKPGTLILFTRNGMGDAPNALQLKLASIFTNLVNQPKVLPAVIAFYGDGVKLACAGSPILDTLAQS